jgi:CTP:molybdopterin cytidylyltransferase MocA
MSGPAARAPVGRRRPTKVAGLLLAAGSGSRFGGPKALAELDGERLVDRAVRILSLGGADPVVVVLGAAVIDVPGADAVVVNEGWAEGMGSSLRAGLAADALAGCGAALVLLVDQPGIRTSAVRRLLEAYDGGADLAVATYEGQRGHPVLLGRDHWVGVCASAVGDRGARVYLAEHPEVVVEVPCDGDAKDADTPGELTGRGVLARIAGDAGSAAAPLAAGFGELGALLGGAGARAAHDEKLAEVVRRHTVDQGEDPRTEVDLDAGVVRIRPRPE